jgi:hypothetical protein
LLPHGVKARLGFQPLLKRTKGDLLVSKFAFERVKLEPLRDGVTPELMSVRKKAVGGGARVEIQLRQLETPRLVSNPYP